MLETSRSFRMQAMMDLAVSWLLLGIAVVQVGFVATKKTQRCSHFCAALTFI